MVETLLAGEVPTYLTTLGIGHETLRLAAEAARDFYTESYGSSVTGGGSIIPGKLDIGSAIFNDIADVLSTPNLYRVGTLYDDDFTLAFGNIAVNTGSGDDTISVPRGWQNNAGNYGWTVIDGGSGHDTVDYSSLSHGVNLKFDAQGSYGGRGVVEKNGIGLYGFKDGLYNIEAVKLTDFKDNVTFNDRVLTPANGLEVNLGKGSSEIRFEHGYTTAPGERAAGLSRREPEHAVQRCALPQQPAEYSRKADPQYLHRRQLRAGLLQASSCLSITTCWPSAPKAQTAASR